MIPFNKPFLIEKEFEFIKDSILSKKLSGNGKYTKLCQQFIKNRYTFNKCLLTTSCTDALEMISLLLNIKKGDEIIIPSYTFVSTANAFVLRGAKIVFADSQQDHPNIDPLKIEELITNKTKAIIVVHYAGVACDLDAIMKIGKKYNLYIIEDAAQAIESKYKGIPLGGIGHFGTYSFHETKNIISGEGGALMINNSDFFERSDIIWEKGTNRKAFFRGDIDKYSWVDIGSSFLPSEITAAFLYAQLIQIEKIQKKRIDLWNNYNSQLFVLQQEGKVKLPFIPDYATHNGHIFYLVCKSNIERNKLISYLRKKGVQAVFHYLPLHTSIYYKDKYQGKELVNCNLFGDCLVRLPLFYELEDSQQSLIIKQVKLFYR